METNRKLQEYTSLELSKRLHDKGFRGEHDCEWVEHYDHKKGIIWDLFGIDETDTVNVKIPAYTFTALWGVLNEENRENFVTIMLDMEDITEALGEFILAGLQAMQE